MWENAAQMLIVSLNWWQYTVRVWSHANSAQPPISHLAPGHVPCCMGRGIVVDVYKVTSKHPCRPCQHLIPQDLDVPMPVHGSIHHDQLTPFPIVDCTPYHDWRAKISIIRLDTASISLSPCLRRTRTWPSLWYKENLDSSLKIQCLHCLSPVLQSEPRTSGWKRRPISGVQKPSPNGPNRHSPPKSALADEEPRWSCSFWPFGTVDGLPVAWRFSSSLHAPSDVVGQSLRCFAKFCLCILETPPVSWLLLADNYHLLTTWQFAAAFALANYMACCQTSSNFHNKTIIQTHN